MGNDLPDYQLSVSTGAMEASSFKNGADAAKPASPAVGDIYLATDTGILYVCNAAGAWTNAGSLYLLLAGGTMSGAIAMGSNKITGLAAPAAAADAARKTEVDTVDAKLDDGVWADVTGSRAVGASIYQNTSGKLRKVIVTVEPTGGDGFLIVYCENNAAPSAWIAYQDYNNALYYTCVTFEVPAGWYYRVDDVLNTVTLRKWVEMDEH